MRSGRPRGGGCAPTCYVNAPPVHDEELVLRAHNGDMDALGVLVERHQGVVTRTVAAMLGRTPEVDDTVQDVFIRFYDSLDRYRGDASLETYLRRIAINRSLDVLRRRKRTRSIFTSLGAPGDSTRPAAFENFDRAEHVHRAVQSLRPHYRSVVVLRLLEGYTTRETAQILGVPVGTVLSRLSRASKMLRRTLQPLIDDDA